MQLNHLNLCTNEVAALSDFFTRYFDFELVAMRGKEALAILQGTDGFALNLMQPSKGAVMSAFLSRTPSRFSPSTGN